jgi:carboxymethylenebutenolidase
MSEFTTLMARDGHEFNAWLAAPAGKPRGAVLVIQEIFGVNAHIRAVTDGYAAEGYVAIAPALFDRVRRGIELGYSPDTMQEGLGYVQQLLPEKTLLDLAASIAVVKHAGRVGVVGFCWGGKLAYVSACELPVACGVAYYGGRIVAELGKTPKCPMLYHFGGQDSHIPPSDIEQIRAVNRRGTFYVYPDADHGFNCDMRASFNAAAAQLARQRTLAFLAQHLRGEVAPPHD